MKKNGFTLIELLGVITILLLITLLILPSVTGLLKSLASDQDEVMTEMIYDAAKLYVSENDEKYKKNNGNTYCINLSTLVDEGYLKSPITFSTSGDDITNLKTVEIIYNKGFDYKLKGISDCIEATGCTIVSGDLDTYGSEVRCGSEYFYIIPQDTTNHEYSNDDTTVSLLAKYNLNVGDNRYSDKSTYDKQDSRVRGYISADKEKYGGVEFTYDYTFGSQNEDKFVYNSESNLYSYLKNYKEYFDKVSKINSKQITLMSLDQWNDADSYGIEGLYNTSFWLGTATNWDVSKCTYNNVDYNCLISEFHNGMYILSNDGTDDDIYEGGYRDNTNSYGVRPVIIVSRSDLE